jgi:hypothetical protein
MSVRRVYGVTGGRVGGSVERREDKGVFLVATHKKRVITVDFGREGIELPGRISGSGSESDLREVNPSVTSL